MKVNNILVYILETLFQMKEFKKASKKDKKIIRNIIKEHKPLKKLDYKKGFVLKLSLNTTYNVKLDYNSIKANNFNIITFKDLLTLYNENYYKYDKHFKILKDIKVLPFIKYDYDIAYLYLIVFNKLDYNNIIRNFYKIHSNKYKANFSKSERKLLYKLKNKEYYSSIQVTLESYKETLEREIISLESEIISLESEIKSLESEIISLESNSREINTIYLDIMQYHKEYKVYLPKKIKMFENQVIFNLKQELKDKKLDLLDLNQDLLETKDKLDSYTTSIDFKQENCYKVNYIASKTNKNYKRYEYY